MSSSFDKGLKDALSIIQDNVNQEIKDKKNKEDAIALLEKVALHIRSQLGDGYYA